MDILKWFDVTNIEHLRAYMFLHDVGVWPMGFIPADVTFCSLWNGRLNSRMAGIYVAERLVGLTEEMNVELTRIIDASAEENVHGVNARVAERARNLEIVKLVRGLV